MSYKYVKSLYFLYQDEIRFYRKSTRCCHKRSSRRERMIHNSDLYIQFLKRYQILSSFSTDEIVKYF